MVSDVTCAIDSAENWSVVIPTNDAELMELICAEPKNQSCCIEIDRICRLVRAEICEVCREANWPSLGLNLAGLSTW